MKYQDIIDYPYSTEHLFTYFTNPDFFVQKYALQGATSIVLKEHSLKDGISTVTVARDVPVEVSVPDFARRLIPAGITLVQTDRWDLAARRGTLKIEFKGLPVRLACQMQIADRAEGAREILDFDIRVDVPLLGGKLEALLAQDLRLKFQRDTEVTRQILAGAV